MQSTTKGFPNIAVKGNTHGKITETLEWKKHQTSSMKHFIKNEKLNKNLTYSKVTLLWSFIPQNTLAFFKFSNLLDACKILVPIMKTELKK